MIFNYAKDIEYLLGRQAFRRTVFRFTKSLDRLVSTSAKSVIKNTSKHALEMATLYSRRLPA